MISLFELIVAIINIVLSIFLLAYGVKLRRTTTRLMLRDAEREVEFQRALRVVRSVRYITK